MRAQPREGVRIFKFGVRAFPLKRSSGTEYKPGIKMRHRVLPGTPTLVSPHASTRASSILMPVERPAIGKKVAGGLLIEVMVCALLLAAGILAVLASQSTGMQSARGAYFYLQADSLVSDMVDRILVNADVATDYAGSTTAFATLSAPACINSDSGCSATDRAVADQADWASLFNSVSSNGQAQPLLPEGLGQIEVNGDEITVWVQWRQEDAHDVTQATTECGAVPAGSKRVCAQFRI